MADSQIGSAGAGRLTPNVQMMHELTIVCEGHPNLNLTADEKSAYSRLLKEAYADDATRQENKPLMKRTEIPTASALCLVTMRLNSSRVRTCLRMSLVR